METVIIESLASGRIVYSESEFFDLHVRELSVFILTLFSVRLLTVSVRCQG